MGQAGVKYDYDTIPVASLLFKYFPRSLVAVASVGEYGMRKYTEGGWRTVPEGVRRYTDADARHLLKEYIEGKYDDKDSGLAHAAQHAWNALARLELMLDQGLIVNMRGNDIGVDGKPILGTARAWDPTPLPAPPPIPVPSPLPPTREQMDPVPMTDIPEVEKKPPVIHGEREAYQALEDAERGWPFKCLAC